MTIRRCSNLAFEPHSAVGDVLRVSDSKVKVR